MKRTASRAATVFKWGAAVVTTLALVAVVALMVVPRLIGWQPVVVLSGSMEPSIPVGGLTFLAPVHADEVKVGDVISYRQGNVLITHRVVEVGQDAQGGLAFTTKGDANSAPDPGAVEASNVVSREVLTIPYLGRVSDFIHSRAGFYALLGVPALLIVANSLLTIAIEVGRQRRKAAA